MPIRRLAILAATSALLHAQAPARRDLAVDQPLRVLASNGIKAVIEELGPRAERAIGRRLGVQFNSTAALRKMIDAGEPFDVAILTAEAIDDLIRQQKLDASTRADLARCGIGAGIRAGARKPDIHNATALRAALLNAKSITFAQDGASRTYIEKMFDRLGVANDVGPKLMLLQGSGRSTAAVASGEADLVITLISEILPVRGIELAGPLPAEFQGYVSFAAGIGARANDAKAAQALVQFLRTPANAPVFQGKGMEPVR